MALLLLSATDRASVSCKPHYLSAGTSRSALQCRMVQDMNLSSCLHRNSSSAALNSGARSRARRQANRPRRRPRVESKCRQKGLLSTPFHSPRSSTPRHLRDTDTSSAFHVERNGPSSTSLLQ